MNPFLTYDQPALNKAKAHIADLIWRNRKFGYLKGMEGALRERMAQIEEAISKLTQTQPC